MDFRTEIGLEREAREGEKETSVVSTCEQIGQVGRDIMRKCWS